MGLNTLIICIVLCVLFFDMIIRRNWRRFREYRKAVDVSKQKNKPLMVIGATDSGGISGQISALFHLYDCGDICVDMNGCNSCKNSVKSRLEDVLPKLKTNSCVIYVSVVLEYTDDLPSIIKELERVSGGDLFIVFIDNVLDLEILGVHTGSYFDLSSATTLQRNWKISRGPPDWEFTEIRHSTGNLKDAKIN